VTTNSWGIRLLESERRSCKSDNHNKSYRNRNSRKLQFKTWRSAVFVRKLCRTALSDSRRGIAISQKLSRKYGRYPNGSLCGRPCPATCYSETECCFDTY